MDVQYGIAVTNKYSVFTDKDEDPIEILRQKEEEAKNSSKKDKKKKKPVATESKPKQQEQLQQIKREDVTQPRQNGRGGGRGGRGRELRENDGSRPPRRQGPRGENFKGDENVPPDFRDRGDGANRRERGEGQGGFDRGGRGMRGGGRGGRGRGRGGPRPESARSNFGPPTGERRREFDRHSGTDRTGVKATEKREGSGAHNWGSYRDDVEDQGQNQNPADVSGEWAPSPVEQQENADPNESGEAAAPPKEDEGPKEMTLDEWKALQGQQRMKANFNIRKAGEGVDNNQWKKGVAYKKKHTTDEEEEESEEEEEEEEDRHGHRKNLVTDIRITFADNPRRGGRGGRGGRGRGGPRGGRGGFGGGDRPNRGGPRESAPRMDDETDFPRLVKSEA